MAIPTINNFVRQTVTIDTVKDLADGVKEFTFPSPAGTTLMPGQFVGIGIHDGQDEAGFRAYSALSDEQGNIQICVKIVQNGRGSTYLHSLKSDQQLDILLPLGYFGFPRKLSDHLYFIATGTGIVPILSLLENLPKDYSGKAKLIFGVRNEKDLFYEDRIQKLTETNPSIEAIITLSQPSANWLGRKGRITVALEEEMIPSNTQCFICGNGGMIASAKAILKTKGVKQRNIFYEDFND